MSEPRLLRFDIPAREGLEAHQLSCAQWGDPARKTVLCVHGLTRNGRDFDALAQELCDQFHVLCPDMPGRGKSQWLNERTGYNNPQYVADIGFMLQALNIQRVTWIGTSMGGIMGMIAANAMPGLIGLLALNDVGAFIPASGLSRIRDIADVKTLFPSRSEAEAAYRRRTATFGIEENQWPELFRYGLEDVPEGTRFTYDPALFKTGFQGDKPVTDTDMWPLWSAVSPIPTLVIRGEKSDILLPQTVEEMKSRHHALTFHEVPGVGHAPSLMQQKEKALIREWISASVS